MSDVPKAGGGDLRAAVAVAQSSFSSTRPPPLPQPRRGSLAVPAHATLTPAVRLAYEHVDSDDSDLDEASDGRNRDANDARDNNNDDDDDDDLYARPRMAPDLSFRLAVEELIVAARAGDDGELRALYDKFGLAALSGALPGVEYPGDTVLHVAARAGQATTASLLVSYGVPSETPNAAGETAFQVAADNVTRNALDMFRRALVQLDSRAVETLISLGADINRVYESTQGQTRLHWAASKGMVNSVEMLLSYGADIDRPDANGYTALHWAARLGHVDTITTLLTSGADPNLLTHAGDHAADLVDAEDEAARILIFSYACSNLRLRVDDEGQLPPVATVLADTRKLVLSGAECAMERCIISLNMSGNALRQLPVAYLTVPDFSHIVELNLSFNRLTSVPREITALTCLETLKLGHNRIASLEPLVCEPDLLVDLRVLHVDNNVVTQVPETIERLVRLKELDLSGNTELCVLPMQLGSLKSLATLHLARCQCLQSVPRELRDSADKVLAFFRDLWAHEFLDVYRTKVVLVGYEAVGKTTLVDALLSRDGFVQVRQRYRSKLLHRETITTQTRWCATRDRSLLVYESQPARPPRGASSRPLHTPGDPDSISNSGSLFSTHTEDTVTFNPLEMTAYSDASVNTFDQQPPHQHHLHDDPDGPLDDGTGNLSNPEPGQLTASAASAASALAAMAQANRSQKKPAKPPQLFHLEGAQLRVIVHSAGSQGNGNNSPAVSTSGSFTTSSTYQNIASSSSSSSSPSSSAATMAATAGGPCSNASAATKAMSRTPRTATDLVVFERFHSSAAPPDDEPYGVQVHTPHDGDIELYFATEAHRDEWALLLYRLSRKSETCGIDLHQWRWDRVPRTDFESSIRIGDPLPNQRTMELSVWDFAGGDEYYVSHPLFLSHRCVYVVTYDLTGGEGRQSRDPPSSSPSATRMHAAAVATGGVVVDNGDTVSLVAVVDGELAEDGEDGDDCEGNGGGGVASESFCGEPVTMVNTLRRSTSTGVHLGGAGNMRPGLEGVEYWMRSVKNHVRQEDVDTSAVVIVVGTHADRVSSSRTAIVARREAVLETARKVGLTLPVIATEVCALNRSYADGVDRLRHLIVSQARAQPSMGELVPMSQMYVEEVIVWLRNELASDPTGIPMVAVTEVQSLVASRHDVKLNMQEMQRALSLLSHWGQCVFFDREGLGDVVVIDPQWLTVDVMAQLHRAACVSDTSVDLTLASDTAALGSTVSKPVLRDGLITYSDLECVWGYSFGVCCRLASLLESFGLAFSVAPAESLAAPTTPAPDDPWSSNGQEPVYELIQPTNCPATPLSLLSSSAATTRPLSSCAQFLRHSRLLIPHLLPFEAPANLPWNMSPSEEELRGASPLVRIFEFGDDGVPDEVFSRIVVRLHPFIECHDHKRFVWSNGVLLSRKALPVKEKDSNGGGDGVERALLTNDTYHRALRIEVRGNRDQPPTVDSLGTIVATVMHILHSVCPGVRYRHTLPCPECTRAGITPCRVFDLSLVATGADRAHRRASLVSSTTWSCNKLHKTIAESDKDTFNAKLDSLLAARASLTGTTATAVAAASAAATTMMTAATAPSSSTAALTREEQARLRAARALESRGSSSSPSPLLLRQREKGSKGEGQVESLIRPLMGGRTGGAGAIEIDMNAALDGEEEGEREEEEEEEDDDEGDIIESDPDDSDSESVDGAASVATTTTGLLAEMEDDRASVASSTFTALDDQMTRVIVAAMTQSGQGAGREEEEEEEEGADGADDDERVRRKRKSESADSKMTTTNMLSAVHRAPNYKWEALTLLSALGDGQYGQVWLARVTDGSDAGNPLIRDGFVALKTLRATGVDPDYAHHEFVREAYITMQFDHPNVLGLLGVSVDSVPPLFIVLEHCVYGNLRDFLLDCAAARVSIAVAELLDLAHQVSLGLAYLHSLNFVHRDIAARNCLVSVGTVVKLADFGLSRALDVEDGTYVRSHHKVKLSMPWMAPEVIRTRAFTVATDVWSFGVLLWEIMGEGKQVPYGAIHTNAHRIMAFLREGGRLRRPAERCPLAVYALMQQCWAAKPRRRPSLATITDSLDRLMGGRVNRAHRVSLRDLGAVLDLQRKNIMAPSASQL